MLLDPPAPLTEHFQVLDYIGFFWFFLRTALAHGAADFSACPYHPFSMQLMSLGISMEHEVCSTALMRLHVQAKDTWHAVQGLVGVNGVHMGYWLGADHELQHVSVKLAGCL